MIEKGYPHPLFSLDLLSEGTQPPEPRYAVPAPGGRLVVRPQLRRRAAHLPCRAFRDATAVALVHHAAHLPAFASFGLDAGWAAGLRHWTGRLLAEERRRADLLLREELLRGPRLSALDRAFALWERLQLSAELAGLGGTLVRGPVPRKEAALLRALLSLPPRIAEPGLAALLGRHGFHAAHSAALGAALKALAEARAARARLEEERQAASDLTAVLRGALLGDLALLGRVARRALRPDEARPLQLERLLPLRPAPARPSAAP